MYLSSKLCFVVCGGYCSFLGLYELKGQNYAVKEKSLLTF